VVLPGYDAAGATLISWGTKYTMTWNFFATYVDEVYGITDASWTQNGGKLAGLTADQLSEQMKYLS